ncbi:unnamed protein product [Prunus armeniaca]
MIEKVKATIYRKEHKQLHEQNNFFDVVYHILVERQTKSSTPLHCLAHSLNPRFYSPEFCKRILAVLLHTKIPRLQEKEKNDFGAINAMNDGCGGLFMEFQHQLSNP